MACKKQWIFLVKLNIIDQVYIRDMKSAQEQANDINTTWYVYNNENWCEFIIIIRALDVRLFLIRRRWWWAMSVTRKRNLFQTPDYPAQWDSHFRITRLTLVLQVCVWTNGLPVFVARGKSGTWWWPCKERFWCFPWRIAFRRNDEDPVRRAWTNTDHVAACWRWNSTCRDWTCRALGNNLDCGGVRWLAR